MENPFKTESSSAGSGSLSLVYSPLCNITARRTYSHSFKAPGIIERLYSTAKELVVISYNKQKYSYEAETLAANQSFPIQAFTISS